MHASALARAAAVGAILCAVLGCDRALVVAGDVELRATAVALGADGASVLVAAGDIARCKDLRAAAATARLTRAILAAHPGARVITTGDHTYPNGTRAEFERCYEPTWGAFNAITAPSPGNHDYDTDEAAPYFDYFALYGDEPSARSRGYYAFEVGGWQLLSLNSNIDIAADSPQLRWLEAALASANARCVLAYWHHPLFSSGFHGAQPRDPGRDTKPIWNVLARFDADLVVNGHTHMYERFAPQTVHAKPAADGIPQFVIGSGGASLDRVFRRRANSAFVDTDSYGVLVLLLQAASYEWAFVTIDGRILDRSAAPVDC